MSIIVTTINFFPPKSLKYIHNNLCNPLLTQPIADPYGVCPLSNNLWQHVLFIIVFVVAYC